MNWVVLLFLQLLYGLLSVADEIKITFWIDEFQQDIYDDIARTLQELESIYKVPAPISESVIVLTQDNETPTKMDQLCEIFVSEGISAVVDWSLYSWQQGIEFVRNSGIPYLRVEPILHPFLNMFNAFLKQKNANNVAMIFQDERDKQEAVIHMLTGLTFRSILLNGNSAQIDFVQHLKNKRPSPTYYAIFARAANMNRIFERIRKGKLFERPDEWHFVYLDPRDRTFKYKQQINRTTIFTLNGQSLCRSLNAQDPAECAVGFTFQRAMLLSIMRSLVELPDGHELLEPLYGDCNATFTSQLPRRAQLAEHFDSTYFMTYSVGSNDPTAAISLAYDMNVSISLHSSQHDASKEIAVWQEGELSKRNEMISPAKRFFRVGTAVAVPWSFYRRHPHTKEIMFDEEGQPLWEGFCIDFIHILSKKLNFEYKIVPPTSGHFGELNVTTGRWDGLVGDLVTGETDFVIAALKMYSEREEVIDFLPPYYEQTGISIVIRKAVRRTSLFKFMTVLRVEVWLSIVAALITTALMIYMIDRFSPYSSRNNSSAYPYECREFTLRESFWFALTSFTPQGGGEAPKAVSGRILVAAYWLFVVLMLATFTANLAAFLTVERMQTPVQSLEQLARQSRINYTVVHESDVHQYFINMKFAEETLYRIWKELALNASRDFQKFRVWDYPVKEQYGHILLAINSSKPVRDATEGFRNVNEHEDADYAFIHDSAEIKYEVSRNCNLTEVGEVFAEQPYAVAVQQGSHLGDELSYAILELQKERFFEELRAKYWNKSDLQDCPQSENQDGITLESLGGVFLATLFGLVLAMIILTLEVVYYKKHNRTSSAQALITQVKSLKSEKKTIAQAWHIGDKSKDTLSLFLSDKTSNPLHITPPPSFEAATGKSDKKETSNLNRRSNFNPLQRVQSRRNLITYLNYTQTPRSSNPYIE